MQRESLKFYKAAVWDSLEVQCQVRNPWLARSNGLEGIGGKSAPVVNGLFIVDRHHAAEVDSQGYSHRPYSDSPDNP